MRLLSSHRVQVKRNERNSRAIRLKNAQIKHVQRAHLCLSRHTTQPHRGLSLSLFFPLLRIYAFSNSFGFYVIEQTCATFQKRSENSHHMQHDSRPVAASIIRYAGQALMCQCSPKTAPKAFPRIPDRHFWLACYESKEKHACENCM